MADLGVSSEGLRAAAGTLGQHATGSALEIAGISGASSQSSITAVRGIATHLSSWHLDESGYHAAMAESLASAAASYETTDHQSGRAIGGVM